MLLLLGGCAAVGATEAMRTCGSSPLASGDRAYSIITIVVTRVSPFPGIVTIIDVNVFFFPG